MSVNKIIADIFDRMGILLEIKGENVFKIRAYHTAAENIRNLSENLETLKNENQLSDIPGIGSALQEKISEYLDTGKMSAYEKLVQEIPETLLEVVEVPSVGPKKAKLFLDELKIKDIAGLAKAAEAGKLFGLPGIQEKTVENILKGIKIVRQGQERMNLATATTLAETIINTLQGLPEVKKITAGGSLRRQKETVRDIDLLIDSTNPKKVMDVFVVLPLVKQVLGHGETKSSILTKENIQVDLRVVEPKSYGAALVYFTGSKEFNIRLRQLAIKKRMKVNEYGIFSMKGGKEKFLAGRTEKECFDVLGLPYVPPELREEIGEEKIFAAKGPLKIPKILELKDIKGDLHVHSLWSDGHNTIEQMADACRAKGYEYVAISDHSASLRVANGISAEDLQKKRSEIDAYNKKHPGFRVLFGTEVEVDINGNLDYNEKLLSEFDVVIAAVHVGLEQDPQKMTQRIIKACRNKNVDILAHPTAVHFGKREPLDIDLKEIFKVAAEHNTFLEINSFPVRFDLNSANAYFARELGAKFVINTDSHRPEHLDFMKFGVALGRRAWLTKKDAVNTLALKELLKILKK